MEQTNGLAVKQSSPMADSRGCLHGQCHEVWLPLIVSTCWAKGESWFFGVWCTLCSYGMLRYICIRFKKTSNAIKSVCRKEELGTDRFVNSNLKRHSASQCFIVTSLECSYRAKKQHLTDTFRARHVHKLSSS